MRYLLDEGLHETAAAAYNGIGVVNGDTFSHILDHVQAGTGDQAIPPLCRELSANVLITVNVRDFGAKKALYEALLASGIHVVVMRPGKVKFYPAQQAALFLVQYDRVRALLADAGTPVLIRVTWTSSVIRDLDQLIAEIEGKLP